MVEPLRLAEMTESDRDAFIRDGRSPYVFDFGLEFGDVDDVLANEVIGTASPPDCDKWSQSIEVLLDDPAGLEVFRTFLRNEGREEGLSFWMAAKMFRDNAGLPTVGAKENLELQARTIYSQYLAKSASQRVFIRDSTARKIGTALQAKVSAGDLFVEAQAEAVSRMSERDYPEFLRSGIFREYLEKASRRRQQQDSHSDVLPTFSVNDNGEPMEPPHPSQSLWVAPEPSPLYDTRSVSTGTGDDATSVSDTATNNEETASIGNQRRQRIERQRSNREAAAFRLVDLPRDEFTEEVPRPRKPMPTYRPEEFIRLLTDRLEEVLRNHEPPSVMASKRQLLDDIAEQPEQPEGPYMAAQDYLGVPPVSSRMSDISSEGSTSHTSAEWASWKRNDRAGVPKRMPTDSGHHSELFSSVEDLLRAASLKETPSQQRHRHLSQQLHEHRHRHKHHHHHYVPKDSRRYPLTHDTSMQKSKSMKDFSKQSVDPWAMASPDQRSVYSSTSAETLSLTYERQYPSSTGSSVVSYRSNPERQPMVFSCATRYDSVHSSQMRSHNHYPTSGRHYRSSSRNEILLEYKLDDERYKQSVPGPTVTLSDFKSAIGGKNKDYKYFFEVRDGTDPKPYFTEFNDDHDILPIYNGRIMGRVKVD